MDHDCPHCDEPMYFSGCEADDCSGWGCPDCAYGCDLDFVDAEEGGACAALIAEAEEEAELLRDSQ